ncbi:RETINOL DEHYDROGENASE [Salix purpurea]|uniref:RETINOL DEHYDROGENASE n=1 Tax=Salix purpurea TaxID=77065 RepID=A0A9Q0Q457_SALPP|nr:RETINOL DEHYDROGENASE [Salix purpurea]
MSFLSLVTGRPGPSGFGSASTAEQVTQGIDASSLTVLITGGANGIGLETTRVLALRKAHVIIAARNMDAANEARQLILKEDGNARVDVLKLDLSSTKSIREFADNFNALDLRLNILINNAGIMFCPYQLSEDGTEMQFATNHVDTARTTGVEGRIVNLSSVAHIHTYRDGIQFDNINDKNRYSDKRAYGQSKLANILHVKELSRRFQVNTEVAVCFQLALMNVKNNFHIPELDLLSHFFS